MNRDVSKTARTFLALIGDVLSGRMPVLTFCDEVEREYNAAVDDGLLDVHERRVFNELFDTVVWYSPYEEERIDIPNYKSEEEVLNAARVAQKHLELR